MVCKSSFIILLEWFPFFYFKEVVVEIKIGLVVEAEVAW